jgi:hypothetical protein
MRLELGHVYGGNDGMKISINIECDSLDECIQIIKVLKSFKANKTRMSLNDNEMVGIDLVKDVAHRGDRLIPLTKWSNYHPWPSVGGLRYLVFFAEANGFQSCVRRAGRRVLIDEKAFFEWMDRQ